MKIRFIADGIIPCPFCGSPGSLQADSYYNHSFVYVACDVCGARSKAVWTPVSYDFDDEEELQYEDGSNSILVQAMNLWNRRASNCNFGR